MEVYQSTLQIIVISAIKHKPNPGRHGFEGLKTP